MLSSHAGDYNVFIGQNAGDAIFDRINSAQKSIKIVSPYISADYIDLLLAASARGVYVLLLTGSDMTANIEKRYEIYKKIITQYRHVDEVRRKIRKILKVISLLLVIASLVVGVVGYETGQEKLLWSFAFTPLFLAILYFVNKVRIYTYTYKTNFDCEIFVSPYDQKIEDNHFFIHSKLYVIDEEVAFVGSVNFTKVAFRRNYECYVQINDEFVVSEISDEISRLMRGDGVFFRVINEIGSKIYPESAN